MFGIFSGVDLAIFLISLINVVLVLAVPAAVIYVIYLLRRIAMNTSPDNTSKRR